MFFLFGRRTGLIPVRNLSGADCCKHESGWEIIIFLNPLLTFLKSSLIIKYGKLA